jgi:hypothetical protein
MDFAIKPVTKTEFAPIDYPYYSLADRHIGFNESTHGDTVPLNVGAVQVGTPESAKVPYIPEVGKGSITDVWA